MTRIAAGPRMTTNRTGRKNRIIGTVSLGGSAAAFFSASDMRMAEAEKKAAALPPKLTVPMILFFLPVLFVVILGPAAIRVMALQ